jgi:adenosylcobinamide kinase/adenosylcobinamide-phosphate guanylyltransferase
MIYFITGGERSGKSSFAQKTALELSPEPVYLATARRWDDDFTKRINRHKADRDSRWTTIEEEKNIGTTKIEGKTTVIDCVTLWLTNLVTDNNYNIEESLAFAREQIDLLFKKEGAFIFVSNELGMGSHAATQEGRKFVELQGWVNQYIASRAEKVWLMVSGIPVKIK